MTILTDTEIEQAEAATRAAIDRAEEIALNNQRSKEQAIVAGFVTVLGVLILHLVGVL